MNAKSKGFTRRDFIKGAGCAAVGVATVGVTAGLPLPAQEPGVTKSKVVLIRAQNALTTKGNPNRPIVQEMLDQAVAALHGLDNPVECWKKMIKPTETVGIKTNVWPPLPTTEAIESAIKTGVMNAGVPEKRIGIDDHGVLKNHLFQNSTALINARPMRTHAWSGVGSLIKNYIMFDPSPPKYHPNSCAGLGALWDLPIVKGKTRLNVLVMLTPLFYGAGTHHFDATYTWPYSGLLVGFDPVAVDTVGLLIFQAKRKDYFGADKPVKPVAHHIALADTKFHIGTSDPAKIELIKLGWNKNILI